MQIRVCIKQSPFAHEVQLFDNTELVKGSQCPVNSVNGNGGHFFLQSLVNDLCGGMVTTRHYLPEDLQPLVGQLNTILITDLLEVIELPFVQYFLCHYLLRCNVF